MIRNVAALLLAVVVMTPAASGMYAQSATGTVFGDAYLELSAEDRQYYAAGFADATAAILQEFNAAVEAGRQQPALDVMRELYQAAQAMGGHTPYDLQAAAASYASSSGSSSDFSAAYIIWKVALLGRVQSLPQPRQCGAPAASAQEALSNVFGPPCG